MSAAQKGTGSVPHVVEFDGLRGYLAWWVVLFHLYQSSGLNAWKIRPLEMTLGQGFSSVQIFFILSGFVIALMDDIRHESYGTFIVRRFFRLAPVYYVMLAVGVVDAYKTQAYGASLWAHVAAHVTMLHGLVPNQVLNGSGISIDFLMWSISVEWQFYLIAPLILRTARRSPTGALALLAGSSIAAYLANRGRLTFEEGAFVFIRGGLFAVGIGSFYLFRHVMTNLNTYRKLAAYMMPFGLAMVWICGGPLVWPGPIWLVLFSAVLAYHAGVETALTRPVRVALRHPVAVWLGHVSYCTYLFHGRVFQFLEAWTAGSSPVVQALTMVVVGFPVILAGSAALHYFIEKPGIRLGKRLASRFERLPTAPAPVPVNIDADADAEADANELQPRNPVGQA
jgi:peptidoglycan/LPS O-acetylase OafA/YrhL